MTIDPKSPGQHLCPHPKAVTGERPIPSELWPDLKGCRKAKVNEWPNTVAKWKEFCKLALNFPVVSVDLETSGLRPFHGDRLVGVSLAIYDGKEFQAGYWNFRHSGHPKHSWCNQHTSETSLATRKTCVASHDKKVAAGLLKDHVSWGVSDCQKAMCPGYVEKAPVVPVELLKLIDPIFKKCIIAGQNFKFDIKMLHVDGIEMPDRVLDTMLIAHLWDENARFYNLDKLAKEIGELKTGDTIKEYAALHGIDVTKTGHSQIPWEVEAPYAVGDTTLVLRRIQFERERWEAASDPKLMEVFQVENGCTPVIANLEINGMKIDMEYIEYGITRLEKELGDITKDIYSLAKKEFDIMSTQQLWEVMEARGLKPLATTPNGAPSLGVNELDAYEANGDDMAKLIKNYRTKHKMLNTYFMPFRDTHADPNGFIHCDMFIHGTVSGRMSSREPNLQNITRPEAFTASNTMRGATAKMIQKGGTDSKKFENKFQDSILVRKCFIPRTKDHSLFFFDYSQFELRIFAEYAEEQFILEGLIRDGVDIHELVAREIFPNFPDKEVNPGLYKFFRQMTKQINFGIIYGMGRNKLAVQLNVPVDETVRYLKMVQKAREEGHEVGTSTCFMTDEEIENTLEDHRVMTNSKQWDGLRALSKEIENKVNPKALEEVLFADGKNLGLLYSAESFLSKYHARFPKIKKFTKGLDSVVRNRGWIFNKYGRRYHLKPQEAYIGVNRLVQGTTADQIKVSKWRIYRLLKGTKSVLVNQVHDEVQIEIHHSELHLVPLIKEAMEYFPNIGVKIQADVEYSHTSWAEKKKWIDDSEFIKSLSEVRGGSSEKSIKSGRKTKKVLAKS